MLTKNFCYGSILTKGGMKMSAEVQAATPGNEKTAMILGVVLVILLFLGIFLIIKKGIKATRSMKKARKEVKEQRKERMNNENISILESFKHFYGLPVTEGKLTQVIWHEDKISFEADNVSFNLPLDRITNIEVVNSVDVQKQLVSSVGGAVGGYALLGPVGAIIGGRVKQKDVRTITWYLIFTYTKDNSVENIAFEVNGSLKNASSFVEKFKQIKPQTVQSFDL